MEFGERSRLVLGLSSCVVAATLVQRLWYPRPRSSWLYEPGSLTHYLAGVLERHSQRRRRPVRVYLDGCFDMFHYGHANALRQGAATRLETFSRSLRQAKACGDVLIVGVVGDSEILANKGPPVFTEEERLIMVESVKWVDVVLKGVPYEVNDGFMRTLFDVHDVDYILHGDDPCLLPDGTDAYAACKKAGRFKMIKRTEGVSTTDLVGRMLMCTTRPSRQPTGPTAQHRAFSRRNGQSHEDLCVDLTPALAAEATAANTAVSHFCPTSRRIRQFSSGRTPPQGARVVYLDGAFDMFHPGHVEALKQARTYGDFLLVGIHTDEAVAARRGPHHPILSLHERSLSVLACKYVDEVIIGAPSAVTADILTTFNIGVVVHGTVHEPGSESRVASRAACEEDPYHLAREAGIFVEMPSPRPLTTADIVGRILGNRTRYEERQKKKGKAEREYLGNQKVYVAEA